MALQAANIADLVQVTLNELGRNRWTDLASTLVDYPAWRNLISKEKVGFDSGPAIQINVMSGTANATRWVGLYEPKVVNIVDVMTSCSIPWRHIRTSWGYDRIEVAMNRSPSKIVDLVKVLPEGVPALLFLKVGGSPIRGAQGLHRVDRCIAHWLGCRKMLPGRELGVVRSHEP